MRQAWQGKLTERFAGTRNHMDENHQDKTESKSIVAEDVKWVLNKRSNLLVPKRKKRTGFEDKTSWDRLQLLAQVVGAFAIPLSIIALIIGVWQFNTQQISDNQKTAEQQKTEFQNLKDQQQQTTLETYLDRMSDLLFTQHLNTSKVGDEVRQVARARTLTALQNLNPARKGILLQFLYASNLIGYYDPTHTSLHGPIINLVGADLRYANLSDANLSGVNLSGADLGGVDLRYANLSDANLSGANLSDADLNGANLSDADLNGTNLSDANLSGANLSGVNLSGVNLSGVNLSGADLGGVNLSGVNLNVADLNGANLNSANLSGVDLRDANLSNADLNGADLNGANLSDADLSVANLNSANLNSANLNGANLSDADLSGAKITQAQLNEAKSLQGTIMPDGSKHP